jgi:hypothetical protein
MKPAASPSPTPPDQHEKPAWQRWAPVALIYLQALLCAVSFRPDFAANDDSARYYLLGQALASGQGYRQIERPDRPVETQFPIAFPLVIAATSGVTGTPLATKVLVALLGLAASVLLSYVLRGQDPAVHLPVLAFWCTSVLLAEYSGEIMSEVPYLAATLLAMFLLPRAAGAGARRPVFWLALACSVLPVHVRTIGIAFSAAWVLVCLVRRHYSLALGHVLLLVATLALLRMAAGASSPYFAQLAQKDSYAPAAGTVSSADMLLRVGRNLSVYGTNLVGAGLAPLPETTPFGIVATVSMLACVLILFGWVRALRSGSLLVAVYVPLYFGVLLLWQTQWASTRFVLPVLPFLAQFAIGGALSLHELCVSAVRRWRPRDPRLPRRPGAWLAWTLAVLLVSANISALPASLSARKLGPDWLNYYRCGAWLRLNAPPDAVVACRSPALLYLQAGRPVTHFPFTAEPRAFMRQLHQLGASYLVFDSFTWSGTTHRYVYPVLRAYPDSFTVVYTQTHPITAVLEVRNK